MVKICKTLTKAFIHWNWHPINVKNYHIIVYAMRGIWYNRVTTKDSETSVACFTEVY